MSLGRSIFEKRSVSQLLDVSVINKSEADYVSEFVPQDFRMFAGTDVAVNTHDVHFLFQVDLCMISLPSGPFVAFAEIPDAGMLCSRLSCTVGPVYFCSYSGGEVILGDSIQAAVITLQKTNYN
jgi:hypothetical protein